MPTFIVLALVFITALVLGLRPRISFDALLEQIQLGQDIDDAVEKAMDYLHFQEQGWSPQPSSLQAIQLGDLYFRLGDALIKQRPDIAFRQYERSIELFPALRHGWPYFQMAQIRQNQSRLEEAQRLYRRIHFYDFGELALSAEYLIALLDHWQGFSVDPFPLYAYLRYSESSVDISRLKEFSSANFLDVRETDFIRALLKYIQDDTQEASRFMQSYLQQHPQDYAAAYYRDDFQEQFSSSLYPPHGELTDYVYAPYAYRNGRIRLQPNGTLRVDFYVAPDYSSPLILKIEMMNPSALKGDLEVSLNRNKLMDVTVTEAIKFPALELTPQPGRNVLSLFFTASTEAASTLPAWLTIQDIRLIPPEPERMP